MPWISYVADGGGFEPPVPFGTHAFQACTINHSVTHPEQSSPSSESYSPLDQACRARLSGAEKINRKRQRKIITAASAGITRRAAIGCRCKTRRSQHIPR